MLFQTPPITFESKAAIIIKKAEEPKQQLYTIKESDTLTSISESQTSSVERLWEKNTQLTSPDQIKPGDTLTIPKHDEALTDRPLPVRGFTNQQNPAMVNRVTVAVQTSPPSGGFSSSGNTYSAGYCTWYAKQMRPDLPNNLGNADTWAIRAGAQGFTISDIPRPGAIGVARGYMHVVYVVGVNPDGTVSISEENYKGFGIVSTRVAPTSEFSYIL